MNLIICFIIGFLLGKLFNYIDRKRMSNNIEIPKTLNIGDYDDEVIEVASGMILLEVDHIYDIGKIDLSSMDNVIFYISSIDKYILYKDKGYKYVKLDTPLR